MMKKHIIMYCLMLLLAFPLMAQDSENDISDLLPENDIPGLEGSILFHETFDEADAWEEFRGTSAHLRVDDGVYLIDTEGAGIAWGLREMKAIDLVISAEITDLSAAGGNDPNKSGVMCRADPSNNSDGYYFFITEDEQAFIAIGVQSSITPLSAVVHLTEINLDEPHEITALCVGDYLALYVNKRLVTSVNDETYTSGYVGLAGQSSADHTAQFSFDNVSVWEIGRPGEQDLRKQRTLEHYNAASWQDAIAELQALGIIDYGGSIVFNENYAFSAGQGNRVTTIARSSPFSDIVMAGEITFTAGDTNQFEMCNLSSRMNVMPDGNAEIYLDVGLINTGDVIITDSFSAAADPIVEFLLEGLDLDQPHHILYVLQDEFLTVYIDGQMVLYEFEVTDRAGTYGISLIGRGNGVRCEGRNIWVYQVPVAQPGVCELRSNNTVNLREGPGTNYTSSGQLVAGTSASIIGKTTGADGFIWWKLASGSWVRDDVIRLVGDCLSVPSASE